jgi:fructokinase
MTPDRIPKVAGIGEILWDVFPEGKRLGGAPANFSYIAHALGTEAYPVSAVGRDISGREIKKVLKDLNLSGRFIQEDASHETGRVEITLSKEGVPAYIILAPAAWDFIEYTDHMEQLAARLDAVCFGSLAQRNEVSRKAIRSFVNKTAPDSIRLLDINLRLNFYTPEIIDRSIRLCTWLKLNDEELETVTELLGIAGSVDNRIAGLQDRYGLELIALTLGADGSRLIAGGIDHRLAADKIEVNDTVGAGDAFSATLVTAALAGLPLISAHEKAAAMSAFLCRNAGATPPIPERFKLF